MAENNHIAELVISARLNTTTSLREINKQIREMGKNEELAKLTIKVDIDKSFVNTMKNFIKSTKGLAEALENQNKVSEKTVRTIQKADGSIEKITTTVKANQEVWNQTAKAQAKASDVAVKSTNKQTQAIEGQRVSLKQMKAELQDYQKAGTRVNRNNEGQVSSLTHTYKQKDTGKTLTVNTDANGMVNNSSKLTDYLKAQQQTNAKILADKKAFEAKDKAHYQALKENQDRDLKRMQDNNKKAEILDKAHYKALQDNQTLDSKRLAAREAMEKLHYKALQENRERNSKIAEAASKKAEAIDKAHYNALKENRARDLAEQNRINTLRENNAKERIAQEQRINKGLSDIQAKRVADDKLHYQALQDNQKFDQNRLNARTAMDKLQYNALKENESRMQKHATTVADLSNKIEAAKSKFKNNASLMTGLTDIDNRLKNVQGSFSQRVSSVSGLSNEMKQFEAYGNALNKLTNQITKAKKQFKGDADAQRGLTEIQNKLQNLNTGSYASRNNVISGLSSDFDKLAASSNRASNGFKVFDRDILSTIGNMARFQVAIMALYAPFQALGNIVQTVFEVDAQMTQLKRVMDDANDFNKILENNIQTANELGRSIQDINEASIGFARMGFDSAQTEDLSKTAGLLQNISDLKAEEAINTLTTAMTVFNIQASDSIQIADKLNEVDNNFGASCFSITA